jgi:hypothetical protein
LNSIVTFDPACGVVARPLAITFFIAPAKKQGFFGSATILRWQRCQNALTNVAALPKLTDMPPSL